MSRMPKSQASRLPGWRRSLSRRAMAKIASTKPPTVSKCDQMLVLTAGARWSVSVMAAVSSQADRTGCARRCPPIKRPVPQTRGRPEGRGAAAGSGLVDDLVGQAVGDGFLGVEVEVAVGVLVDAVDGLAGGVGEDLVELGAELFHFLGLDVDVGRRAD